MSQSVRWLGTVLGLAVAGVAAMGVMLLTGYVPPEGFSEHVQHAVIFALTAGVTSGLMIALCLIGLVGGDS